MCSKADLDNVCLSAKENHHTVLPDSIARDITSDGRIIVDSVGDRTREDIRNNRPGEKLRQKILSLPDEPGVYLFAGGDGKIIYVGKAKRLKRRVSSYFNRFHDSVKTNILVKSIVDLRFVVVATEEDALHLENAMIKQYHPKYNVLLKDDKSYPFIVVTTEMYPRVFLTRDKEQKGGKFYGPYSDTLSAKTVLQLIRELFPIRSCRHFIDNDFLSKGKGRLCLDYHIKKCDGVCKGLISSDEYGVYVDNIRQILSGDTSKIVDYLRDEMEKYSNLWKFEEAQIVKERLQLVERYNSKSVIGSFSDVELDIFAYDEMGDFSFVNYIHFRNGAVIRSLTLEYKKYLSETKEEILSMAISEIVKRFLCKLDKVIVQFLPDVSFEGVEFIVPQRGDKKKLLDVGIRNVTQYRIDRERIADKIDPQHRVARLMKQMQSDFRLSEEPRHIECFDNSNIQGTNPVASCVVFKDGRPSKKDYRHFNIKTVEGANDFASMKEVLHRRYTRLMAEGEELPQMVVVDGGKGQLSAAVEAFEEMGIRGIVALVGIAKRLEEIYFPGDSVPLYIDKKSESLRVIQAMRDEAHRFGITHHRNRRSKSQISSELSAIPGIGPQTITTLLRQFKSVRRLKEVSEDEMAQVVGKAKARLIVEGLQMKSNQ